MIDFRSIHLDHQVILMDRRIQPGKFRLVTHIISYFIFNYIHQILVHCHSACFCNRHPFNLLLHCFLCIFIDFYTDFPYVLIKNALSMYGRPVQLYVSILILETVSPILHEMSHSLMVCRSVSMVCVFCSLMFRFTACISSSVVVDSCQPLFTIIFLDLLLVLEVSGCFSYILLETTTYSINEISKIVGYDNQLYFSRLFHKLKGYSPREYQKIRNKF